MDDLRELDHESCNDSEDLVEYTAEEDDQDQVEPLNMDIDLEDLVEESNHPEESAEEVSEEYYTDGNATTDRVVLSRNTKLAISPKFSEGNKISHTSTERTGQKLIMVPQTSVSAATTMKLLNSSQTVVSPTMTTTSYRLLNSDGTMIMNVSNKPTTVKKLISVTNSSAIQHAPSKVTLNSTPRMMQLPAQNIPTSSGNSLKQMTVAKTITMKTIPSGAIKMVSQSPISSNSTVLRVTKPNTVVQGVSIGTASKIIKNSSNIAGNEISKVVIKPNASHTPAKKIIAASNSSLHAVSVPGVKGLQYVRVMNQRPTSVGANVQKIVVQTANKVPNSPVSVAVTTAPTGASSATASKLVVQNNKTYIVRNGSGNVTAAMPSISNVGKPTIVPASRKIILNTENVQLQEQPTNSGTTRIILKKEDIKSIVHASQLSSTDIGCTKGTNIDARKKDHQTPQKCNLVVNKESISVGSDIKNQDVSVDSLKMSNNTGYGFPEEAYKKRPCNCTKSQCLKLYCDCFANGEFCYNCNCKDCYNTFDHTNERQKAIRSTLERNPNAFKPKIGSIGTTDDGTRLHTKGCNCKRSGCLKNYCECYEGKIACSSNCKCVGCRNTDQFTMEYDYFPSHDTSKKLGEEGPMYRNNTHTVSSNIGTSAEMKPSSSEFAGLKRRSVYHETDFSELPLTKQPHNFMTLDVIEATVQCMVAQADECLKRGCSMRTSERMILEEYGRCLLEINEFAFNTET
ncbi:protein lin-54 homolog [Anopheles nili]|uniref:protein lin-54 homolog n=1 Tax=Anopheles nili TaxID=185578 RepID=UPI00237ACB35|nr:protein lin-54 homolog [Anopheles nili]